MSTSEKVIKFDNLVKSLNKIIFGREDEDVVLDGVTKPTWSKWLKSRSSIIDNKADKLYVDTALAAFQGGSTKFYATLAEANADISNIMPKLGTDTVKDLVNIGEIDNGGVWYKINNSSESLTKSPYDPVNLSRDIIDESSFKVSQLNENNISLVDFRPASSFEWATNSFNTLIFCSAVKNASINFLSIPSWYISNFDYLRVRVIDLKNSFDWYAGMTLDQYIALKSVMQDFTISAEEACFGAPRILSTGNIQINNGTPSEIRIPFDLVSSFGDKTLNLGIVVDAFFSDGSQAIIGATASLAEYNPPSSSPARHCFYTENKSSILAYVTPSFSFCLGFEKANYKQDVRSLLNSRAQIIKDKLPIKNSYSYNGSGDGKGYWGLGITFKSMQASDFNCVSLNLNGLARLDHLRYTIFAHYDSGDINNGFVGYASGTPIYSDKVIVDVESDDTYYDVDFVFDRSIVQSNTPISIFVQGIIDNQVVAIGFTTTNSPDEYTNNSEKGWYAGYDTQLRFNALSDQAITRTIKKIDQTVQKISSFADNSVDLFKLQNFIQSSFIDDFTVNARNVKFNTRYINAENRLNIASDLTFDATATQTVTKTITLLKSSDVSWENRNTFLARDMRNIIVKQGGVTLVKDVDYKEFNWYGKLNAIKDSLNNVSVDVTYTFENYRVDIVALDTYWRRIEVIKGTERSYDPYEYISTLTENYKPLALALIHGSTVEFMPLGDVFRIVGKPNNPSGDYLAVMENNRKALAATFAKLNRGENIKLIGYGDSITACEYVGTGGKWGTANGKERDRADYLEHYYPSDSKALTGIKKFMRDDGDGTFEHAEIGWNWSLKNHIESKFGVVVDYQNWAIGGGNITDGKNRMSYVLPTVSDGDIAVVCYGTNGGLNFDDLNAIVKGFQSKNVSVVLMPTPIANPANNHSMSNQSQWSSLNGYMMQEAMRLNCAIVPTWHYLLEHSPMSIGLSPKFRSNQNLINHPGLFEFQCYGKMLVNAFTG